jgi:glutathione S-transferase
VHSSDYLLASDGSRVESVEGRNRQPVLKYSNVKTKRLVELVKTHSQHHCIGSNNSKLRTKLVLETVCPLTVNCRNSTIMSPSATAATIVPRLKIIGGAGYRTFRNIWMLEELCVPYEHVPAQPQSSIVMQYNPLGKIPVLVEEDERGRTLFSIYESGAINTYLGDKYSLLSECRPDDDNLPTLSRLHHPEPGTHTRALYEQTMSVILTELDAQGLWIHRKHDALGHIFGNFPDAVAHAQKYFNKTNRLLMKQLEDSMQQLSSSSSDDFHYYLLGSQFTAVDICYVHCLDWATSISWDQKWRTNDVVLNYLDRVKSRPAYQKVKSMRRLEQHQGSSKM